MHDRYRHQLDRQQACLAFLFQEKKCNRFWRYMCVCLSAHNSFAVWGTWTGDGRKLSLGTRGVLRRGWWPAACRRSSGTTHRSTMNRRVQTRLSGGDGGGGIGLGLSWVGGRGRSRWWGREVTLYIRCLLVMEEDSPTFKETPSRNALTS